MGKREKTILERFEQEDLRAFRMTTKERHASQTLRKHMPTNGSTLLT
jgi:hypothetical protein